MYLLENADSQKRHLYLLSVKNYNNFVTFFDLVFLMQNFSPPVCNFKCLSLDLLCLKSLKHTGHLNGIKSSWLCR